MTLAGPLSRRRALALSAVAAVSPLAGDARPASYEPRRIDRDVTLADDLLLAPGTRFDIDAGATLTLLGDLVAPARQIFFGEGRVDLQHSRVVAARPEWWGARVDDPDFDCLPALQACLEAHVAMQMCSGDYHIADTLRIGQSNRRIWGIGRANDLRGTRIVKRGGAGAVVMIGSDAAPGTINDYPRGIDMRWIVLGRTAAERTGGDPDEAPTGLRVRHVLDCRFEGLRAHEHAIGYAFRGAVRTYVEDCMALRSIAGGIAGDFFVGFHLDGRPNAAMAGGNASLYLIDCNARTGGRPSLSFTAGARLTGLIADSFLVRLETTEVDHGIIIDGRASVMTAEQRRQGYADVRIESPVLDACLKTGISIADVGDQALIEITTPYVALAQNGRTALTIARSGGGVGVIGGQLIGWPASVAGGNPLGLGFDQVTGVSVAGLKLLGFDRPVEARGLVDFDIALSINARQARGTGPAVRLVDCQGGTLHVRLSSDAPRHRAGVLVDGNSARLSINATGLDVATIAGGAQVMLGTRLLQPGSPGPVQVTGPASM